MTLKLNGSSSGYTAIDAPAAAGSNTLVLPADNGSANEFLQTNGSGVLDWAAAAGGGKVLQVIHSKETSTTYTPAKDDSALTDFAGVDTSLTPAHANNKIICIASTQYEASGSYNAGFRIRNTTSSTNVTTHSAFQLSANHAHERQTAFIIGYDHPNSTSAQAYKVQGNNWSAATTSAVFGGNGAGITLTLIEIDLS